MFSQDTLAIAMDMAVSLQNRNIFVAPAKPEMSKLLEPLLYPIMNANQNTAMINTDLKHIVELFNSQKIDGDVADANNEMMYYLIQGIAATLIANIELTQTVAIPMIATTLNTVNYEKNRIIEEITQASNIDITQNPLYVIMDDTSVRTMVGKYNDSKYLDVNSLRVLSQELTYEEIVNLMTTGMEDLDRSLLAWASNVGEDNIKREFNFLFVKGDNYMREVFINSNAYLTKLVRAIIGLFVGSNLKGDKLPDGIDLPYETLQVKIMEFRSYCGYVLSNMIREYDLKRNTGNVVINSYKNDKGQEVLEVIQANFDKLGEMGVTPDVLVGCSLSGGTWFVNNLAANKEKYALAFQQHNAKIDSQVKAQMRSIIQKAIRNTVMTMLTESKGEYKLESGDITIKITAEQLDKAINDKSNILGDGTNDANITNMVRLVIADSVFSGTMVSIILQRMDILGKNHPNLTVNQMGLNTMTSLCIDFLMSQLKVYNSVR